MVRMYAYIIPKIIWILVLPGLNFLLRWFEHRVSQKLVHIVNSSGLPSMSGQILLTCKLFSNLNSTVPHFCLLKKEDFRKGMLLIFIGFLKKEVLPVEVLK